MAYHDHEDAFSDSTLLQTGRVAFILLQIFILLLFSAWPFYFWHVQDVRPAFFVIAVFHWSIFQPRAFPPWACFTAGLLLDLLHTGPLGLNALLFVVLQGLVRSQRQFMIGQSFMVLWMCFFLVCGGAFILLWVVFCLFSGTLMTFKPMVFSAALTGILYPIMAPAFSFFGRRLQGR